MSGLKPKAVVFDFDGTLADSFLVFTEAVQHAIKRPLSAAQVAELREHPARDILKLLKIPRWRAPQMVLQGRREMDRRNQDITFFDGVPAMLEQLAAAGYQLYIVSSHSEHGIRKLLARDQLAGYIDRVYANASLLSKARLLKKLLRDAKLAPADCVFVGDEVRDIEAAHKVGMPCIAVAWGFNTARVLQAHHPDFLVDTPQQLVSAVTDPSAA